MQSLVTAAARDLRGVAGRAWRSNVLRKGNIYVLSSAMSQGVMFVAWMFLPWKLSPAEIGQFALASFGTDLLMRFILMGTDSAIIRFYVDEERRVEVLRAAWAWLLIGVLAALATLWLTRDLIPRLIEGLASIYGRVMWLMLATAAATAAATTVFAHYIASGNAAQFGRLTVLRSTLIGSGFVAAAWLGLGVQGLLSAQLLAALVVVATFRAGWPAAAGWAVVSRRAMGDIAVYGLPMTAYSALGLLSDYTGRLLLDRYASLSELGVYQFYFQIAVQVNGLWASLNRAWTPFIFRVMSRDRAGAFQMVRRAISLLSALYALGLVLCVFAGKAGVWSRVLPAAYATRVDLFYLLLLGPLFVSIYTAMTPPFYFGRNTVRISLTQTVIAVMTMLLSVYMTIRYGANGAAAGWVAGLFLAPILYMVMFPRLLSELKSVALVLAVWGSGAVVIAWALLQLRSAALAMAVLLLCVGAVAALGWRDWHAPPVAAA